jgi:CheY-like chemotaxis protein
MRFLLRVTFELEGHEVAEAPNGLVAIHDIENGRPPDLVATDFMMPLMNGGEFIARLRANPATADLPVILVSASPGSERKTSADAFFRKPFDSIELGACAAELLERRRR